jgi:alpha/beta hydrolase fold
VVSGDSAGGGLALAVVLALRDEGGTLPAGCVLLSPWLDLGADRRAVPELVRRDVLLSPRWLEACAIAYARPPDWANPSVSPLLAAHGGLPPLLIQAGSHELLAPDSGYLAARASAAGVDVTYTRWPRMWHDFALQPGLLAAADSALSQAGLVRGNHHSLVTSPAAAPAIPVLSGHAFITVPANTHCCITMVRWPSIWVWAVRDGRHARRGLAVPSSGIIDLVIGLTFVFGVTAALSSAVTELIARLLGLRGAYLLTGLHELVDGGDVSTDLAQAETAYRDMQDMMRDGQPSASQALSPAPAPSATGALLGGPILSSQGMTGQISSRKLTLASVGKEGRLPKMTADRQAGSLWAQRRSLPSYISSQSFAEAVIDLVVPDAAGQTTMDVIKKNVDGLPASPLRQSLQVLVKNAGEDVGQFRTAVERWYDDHMDRVSGWYKRHVAKITLAVGAVLVVLLNINALTIGRTLYTESAVSTAVSTVAGKVTSCPAGQAPQDCLAQLQGQLSAAAAAGLPIGWGAVRDCTEPNANCNWLDQRGIFSRHGDSGWQLVLVLIGFVIMVIALVPGAQFWFGLLSKLGTLRATGPKPATAGG